MAIRAKVDRPASSQAQVEDEAAIEALIAKGGAPASKPVELPVAVATEEELKFTLRLQGALMRQIDQEIKRRPGKISRNQWITEAIVEQLETAKGRRTDAE